jgi:chorismate mutase
LFLRACSSRKHDDLKRSSDDSSNNACKQPIATREPRFRLLSFSRELRPNIKQLLALCFCFSLKRELRSAASFWAASWAAAGNFVAALPVCSGRVRLVVGSHFVWGGFMEVAKNGHDGLHDVDVLANNVSVHQVVKAAHEELRQLLHQRAEIMKRIGTVKQTITGLADLFGEEALGEELLDLIDRKPNGRQPGFTKACRRVLMEVRRPMGAREVCAELERQAPAILARHKDPLASVTTVLNRLVDYGEARSLSNDRGRRVWEWVSEGEQTVGQNTMSARIPA